MHNVNRITVNQCLCPCVCVYLSCAYRASPLIIKTKRLISVWGEGKEKRKKGGLKNRTAVHTVIIVSVIHIALRRRSTGVVRVCIAAASLSRLLSLPRARALVGACVVIIQRSRHRVCILHEVWCALCGVTVRRSQRHVDSITWIKSFFSFFASDIAYCIVQSNFVCLLVLFNYGVDILLIWENSVLIDEKYGVNYYKL